MATKLQIPDWYRAEYPSIMDSASTITGFDKVFAHHVLQNEITDTEYFDRGVTHLSKLNTSGFPNAKKCYLFKPEIFPSSNPTTGQIQGAADGIATKITSQSVIADQFREGSPSQPDNYGTAKVFYERLSNVLGANAANNNLMWCYDSYDASFNADFFDILGIGTNIPTHERFRNALGSEAGARKHARNNGSVQADDPFYGLGMHEFTNSLTMALYSIDGVNEHWLYHKIFESQRKYAAKESARTFWYSSPWTQSVNTGVDTHGSNPGWIRERTGGYWKSPNWHILPTTHALCIGFLGCLLSEGVYIWEGLPLLSRDLADDRIEPYAPAETWVSTGGSAPALAAYGEPYYPKYPCSVIDEVAIGVHWYNQVRPIVNAAGGMSYAAYIANGQQVNIQPGNPRLFRNGFRNYGQDTILYHAANRKGVALVCQGNGFTLVFYCNPYKGLNEKEDVVVQFGGNNYPLGQVEGSWPHVFIF